jgi:magnesium-dependent phosphatase 1
MEPVMELVVFDLDFTLWNAGGLWCDQTHPPYRKSGSDVIDSHGSLITLYPDVPEILRLLTAQNVRLAVASRTHEPSWAREIMDLLDISHYFAFKEIYPGPKTKHFARLREQTGVTYNRMLFFDDETRNIDDVGSLGVTACLVKNGITMDHIPKHLFRKAVN